MRYQDYLKLIQIIETAEHEILLKEYMKIYEQESNRLKQLKEQNPDYVMVYHSRNSCIMNGYVL